MGGDGVMGGEEEEERGGRAAVVRSGQLGVRQAELALLYQRSPPTSAADWLAALLHNSSYVTTYGCAAPGCVCVSDSVSQSVIHASLRRQSF